MIQKVFGVRDSKALAFLQPFFAVTAGAAIRAFTDAVNEGNSPLSKHPGDYILYELSDFDDATGSFVCLGQIKMLGTGSDYVSVIPPQNGQLGRGVSAPADFIKGVDNGVKKG